MLGWESYSEIIGIRNITLTPQKYSKSGSYIVGETYGEHGLEPDTANATISILTSTGENRNLIVYCVLGGALLIIGLGVILIKKYVLSKKV